VDPERQLNQEGRPAVADSIETIIRTKSSSACPLCGEPIAGNVSIQLRSVEDDGGSISRRASFCDTHAAETWNRMYAILRDNYPHKLSEQP
jgi:hypothetical protein